MNLFPTHIKYNGKLTPISDLLQRQMSALSDWETQWMGFLQEWYNQNDYIEVNTSGSTGTPKTIKLNKDFVAASAQRTIQYFNLKKSDRILHCLPTRYIAGKLMVVRALLGELDLHIVDPTTDFQFLKQKHFKFAAMVPKQVHKLLINNPNSYPERNLEFLLIGGSAVPQSLINELQSVSTHCYSSYAMTETATHIALQKLNGKNQDQFYHCLDNIKVQLSPDNCLEIFMPGLNQQPIKTNDLAELADQKTFRVLGRADNVIISGGIKFSPEQLERKLEPFISSAFSISSLPHETLGQQLILIVEGEEDQNLIHQIQTICSQQLSKYEQPKEIRFIKIFPRTENGKVMRKAL
ncbi:AMP-binding protein [uncultured Sunxiuqinia sp.]|uniref:AMP-binding protein n=1 Tax=uncultured Sunxiuqinia sp. TaxID=1573825 RepID=UPI002AA7DF5E|nr:AMP-binding protein [uncultured Sunxiuqinia sp.]